MKIKNEKKDLRLLYYLPIGVWMTMFFALPTLIVIYMSFLKKGLYGGIDSYTSFTLSAFTGLFAPEILQIIVKTLKLSVIITIIVIILSLPTAYFISRSKHKNLWLLLVAVPFFTNFLIRIFGLIGLIGNSGIINKFLVHLFGLTRPLPLLYNKFAVVIVSVYIFMPYAIFPLYTAIEKFDFSLIDAARDLGANSYQALLKVFVPGIKGGIATAVLLTFVPAIGSYAVPDIVGGTDGLMLGNVIANKMLVLRDWPSASAMSTVFVIVTIICMVLAKKEGGEDGK